MRFFSANGVYNVSGMEILTQPGQRDVYMTAFAEDKALTFPNGSKYFQEFDLDIKECQIGEAQLKRGNNYIC